MFTMSRVGAKRPLLLVWALAWLCCVVSLDLLHNLNHGLLEEGNAHRTCLVCEFGHQPAQVAPSNQAAVPVVSIYAEGVFANTGTSNPLCRTSPQPLIPRGPPSPFLFVS